MEGSDSFSIKPDELVHAPALAQHAEEIRQLHKRAVEDVIEIGRRLSECKQILSHGNWLPWLEREFAWSERTARNLILVYDVFKSANAADLKGVDLSSLYLLAAPSTPPEARAELINRASAGEKISRTELRRVIQHAKQQRTAPTSVPPHSSVKGVPVRSARRLFRKLSNVQREVGLAIAERDGVDIWHEWAADIASFKRRHRDIVIVLDLLEAASRAPIPEIVKAIPNELRSGLICRLQEASEFLSKLSLRLAKSGGVGDEDPNRAQTPARQI